MNNQTSTKPTKARRNKKTAESAENISAMDVTKTGNGEWGMGNGEWEWEWEIENGKWEIENGKLIFFYINFFIMWNKFF